ncbi:hypothetical protein [Citreimonas salinaria]|uniref:Uncharacterized protein n=1 Tax=Citreimonas salinaria TaxID=321339 RepID=A0A1H3NTR8_9RHOB|nr:hypothetical protein [Citreimonas salinaria]SDY92317.1 hypothetical protein SAMN05444340_13112 [Citreimonas salinaria]
MLGHDLEILEAIVANNDNLGCGATISVHGGEEATTALTDDGIEELKDMLTDVRGERDRRRGRSVTPERPCQ